MADEIAQVVDLEYKGIYYLLKGTKAMIASMVSAIKALHTWQHKKWLEAPGSCSWQKIQEASEDMAPILEFPKEMFEKSIDITNDKSVKGKGLISPFEYYCRQNGLRYCIMPDLNPYDDYIPVAVLSQDFGMHDEQIKSFMRKRVENEEAVNVDYDKKIEEAKGRLNTAQSEEEKEEIQKEIKGLEEGKSQNENLLKESKEKMERNNVLEFAEYLKQGKGSCFEDNPDKALEQAQSCGVVKEFMADDCMYPIRDSGLVPDSKEVFYNQKTSDDTLLTVKRSFEIDDNGVVYSIYEVTDPVTGAKKAPISDKGYSKEAWQERLPQLLKQAGMLRNQPCSVVRSEEGMKDYILSLDENFTKAREDGQNLSEEVKVELEQVRKDASQTEKYVKSYYSTVTVPATQIMPNEKQVLSLELEDGLVEGVSLVDIDSDNAKISLRSDASYTYTGANGEEKVLTGDQIIKALSGNKQENVSQTITQTVTQKSGGR